MFYARRRRPTYMENKLFFWEDFKPIIFTFAVLIVVLGYLGGCASLNHKLKLNDDNIIEEIVEQIIESKLGVDIDLTPNSPE